MEDRNDIHYEDDALDRELNALVREIEQEEVIRRAGRRAAPCPQATARLFSARRPKINSV
jgi:hypothetical protein